MALKLAADLKVDAFGVTLDEGNKRLDFPHATAEAMEGSSGGLRFGLGELAFEQLYMRLDQTHWQAESGSASKLWMRMADGSLELLVGGVELPHGVMIVEAASGVEIVAPHALLTDSKLSIPDVSALQRPSPGPTTASTPGPGNGLNGNGSRDTRLASTRKPRLQDRLHFLDAVSGEVSLTIRVELDLPVLGVRTIDQALRIPICDGSIDFRALDKSLDWLEGAVLDISLDRGRLAVSWRIPIIAPTAKVIVSWELDDEAHTMATFGRVPLRSLADIRFPDDGKPARPRDRHKKSILRSFTIADIQARLSLGAPRSFDVGRGTILLGGDDAPGIVDLELGGTLTHPPGPHGPGALLGAIGVLDTTLKDLQLGGVGLTVDRLHFNGIETIGVSFAGFEPVAVLATVNRVTAINLRLFIGAEPEAEPEPATPTANHPADVVALPT